MKKYFSLFLILLVTILLGACEIKLPTTTNEEKPHNEESQGEKPITNTLPDHFRKLSNNLVASDEYTTIPLRVSDVKMFQNFSFQFAKWLFCENKNDLFSGPSLYYAMAMLYMGATDQEIVAILKDLLTYDASAISGVLDKLYQNNHYKNDAGCCYFANSVWLDYKLDYHQTYVDKLVNGFNAESFLVSFESTQGKQRILDWINDNTENLLDLDLENYPIDDDLAFMLLNTLYFNNEWNINYEAVGNKMFYPTNKEAYLTPFLNNDIYTKYANKKIGDIEYQIVKEKLKNNNYIYLIMPQSGSPLDLLNYPYQDVINLTNVKDAYGYIYLPKFSYQAEYEIDEVLKEKGYGRLFAMVNGYREIAEDVYISLIKQNTGIVVDEKGVAAAAVTQIVGKFTGVMDYPTFRFDHPFLYIIADNNDIPLFIGTVYEPKVE